MKLQRKGMKCCGIVGYYNNCYIVVTQRRRRKYFRVQVACALHIIKLRRGKYQLHNKFVVTKTRENLAQYKKSSIKNRNTKTYQFKSKKENYVTYLKEWTGDGMA